MITYIIEVSIVWVVLYGLYHLLLRQTTFFSWNRATLIGFLGLGLLLPRLSALLPIGHTMFSTELYYHQLTETYVSAGTEVVAQSYTSWVDILLYIHMAGVSVSGMRFLYGLAQIARLYYGGKHTPHADYNLVRTKCNHKPFSFFGSIFIAEAKDEKIEAYIITHEQVHIRQRHSVDVLFLSILHVLFWFHPILVAYRKELLAIHEYLADAQVIQSISKKAYGHILLQGAISRPEIALTNQFFNSQIKNRIDMMYKKSSSGSTRYRYLLVFPLSFAMVILMAQNSGVSASTKTITFPVQAATDTIVPPSPPAVPSLPTIPVPPPPPNEWIKNGYTVYINGKKVDKLDKEIKGYNIEVDRFKKVIRVNSPSRSAPTPVQTPRKEKPYKRVDEMPRFPGCEDMVGRVSDKEKCAQEKMLQHLYSNLIYPEQAHKNGTEGMVVIRFMVEKDGSLQDFQVVRDVVDGCSEAALAAVKSMPTWIPGKDKGKVVKVQYTLPIRFKMENDTEKKPAEKE